MKVNTFYNVVTQDGADPWVYKHTDGWYYMTRTTGGDVRIWRSRTFTSWDASESRVVWTTAGSKPPYRDIWAPELHFVRNAWYVYFAAASHENGQHSNHRMFVTENTNADPFTGSFTFKGQIKDDANKWAIDGTVLQHPFGRLFFIWSGWEKDGPEKQILYIAQMSNPWTICSKRVEISRPTLQWETRGGGINEGPQVAIRNSVISIVYSASGSWTNDYCLGLLSTSVNSDPMNPTSWQKYPQAIFISSNNVFGPGHHSFTKSPDDQEDWIVYHSARYSGAGWDRQIRAQRFVWNYDSTPNLGEPVDRNKRIRIPSGDHLRDHYEARDVCYSTGSSGISGSTSINQSRAVCIEDPQISATFNVYCETAGDYVVAIRNCNGSPDKAPASHWLTINNQNPREITVKYSGWGTWGTNIIRAKLVQGANTLTFKKGKNSAQIDGIDLFLDDLPPTMRF